MTKAQNTPIIEALKKYINDRTIRFHMPGHKGGQITNNAVIDFLGSRVFEADVTNVPGMDDLHQTHGVIKEAQELAARTFGADATYFLINGSSCGLQALVMAACNPGDKILVPRNIHRSILSGIILSGAVPVFFMPEYDQDFAIPLGVTPTTIANSLAGHPDVKAVMLVNPTYHGITSDLSTIAKIVHRHNVPLLVDEAHGPHLYFHEDLPKSALDSGADATVHGTHKMLAAFTQASMLHVKGDRINRQRLEASLRLLQSTSTSYLLLASLDGARAQIAEQGRQLVDKTLDLARYLRGKIKEIPGFRVFGEEKIGQPGVLGLDLTKVTVSVRDLKVTGFWAEQWLREKHHIQVEMSNVFNLLLLLTFGNWRSDVDYMLKALNELSEHVRQNPKLMKRYSPLPAVNLLPVIPEPVLTPREAFWAQSVATPLQQSVGRVCAEVITCYPPGIPVICPGERITSEIVEYLSLMRAMGVHFQGCYDGSMENVLVVK
ncbi:Arginine decarboxylase [Desulfotomaculum nigrificans CO-1-SRB]|uniref:Arginine decarboxylase n=1 Tax=Desulfotomaculum nigrificans (strain DSM 14880 / VKM B-2319 / CO-1-SRB) TaxID=868595 RepID=F6B9S8_DESCC|nr:aminotransferase class I/II-fold pyridoxal phosphate-dependent enzyme [Desulfotomaculum nigrificans]AEF93776.1 Arginine decarboxylase [Desulfotomaculum nigrificans CO-1-SRB]